MKYNIGYIGESSKFFEILQNNNQFNCKIVYCEKLRITRYLEKIAVNLLVPISNENHLETHITETLPNVDFFVMYSTSLIIPQSLINRYDFYNIHPGSIVTNRGRNPIVWSILLGDASTCLTLYKISQEIDFGTIISEQPVDISCNDTFSTLRNKLENKLLACIKDLSMYLVGKKKPKNIHTKGIYRKKISQIDYTIDIETDSLDTLMRKINSQDIYNGALLKVENTFYYITAIRNSIVAEFVDVGGGGGGNILPQRYAKFCNGKLIVVLDNTILYLDYKPLKQ